MRDHRFAPDAFPQIVAHRGASSTRPENTLTSFAHALELGARIVELDVRLSRDGVPVVIHDPTIDRTTTGSGAVHEMTAAEISTLEIPPGEHIPTLAEVFDLVSGAAAVAIEIKNLPGEPAYEPTEEAIVRATHAELERSAFEGPVLLISFNPQSIAASKAIASEVPTGFLTTELVPPAEALAHAIEVGHDMILPGTRSLIPAGSAFVERAHAAGTWVGTWTSDDPDEVRRLLEDGVDAIASNDPAMALGVLHDR